MRLLLLLASVFLSACGGTPEPEPTQDQSLITSHPPIITFNKLTPLPYDISQHFISGTTMYSLINSNTDWASINSDSGVFSVLSPPFSQTGNNEYSLTIKALNGNKYALLNITFKIVYVNSPPVIGEVTIPPLYSHTLYPFDIQILTSDLENDPITLTLDNNPSFLSLNQNILTISKPPLTTTNYSFSLSLNDAYNAVSHAYSILHTNTAPILSASFSQSITITPSSGFYSKSFSVTDADTNANYPTLSPSLDWITIDTPASAYNGSIRIDSSIPTEGVYNFTLAVDDAHGQQGSFGFVVNVTNALGSAYSALNIENYIPTPLSILSSNQVTGRFINRVTEFPLPSTLLDANLTWSSISNYISFINDNLIIAHPSANQLDENAVLTATIEVGGETMNKDFNLVIRKKYIHDPIKQLFVLVSFNDIPMTYSQDLWSDKIFTAQKSLKNYFIEASGGLLSINPIIINNSASSDPAITDNNPNDGIIEVNLAINQPIFNINAGGYSSPIHTPALEILDPYIDFSTYDLNNDGILQSYELNIVFITAGCEQATDASCTSTWAHSHAAPGGYNTPLLTLDGVMIGSSYSEYLNKAAFSRLAFFGESHLLQKLQNGTTEVQPAGAGIIAHEVGHNFLFLPDLYTPSPIANAPAPLKGIGYWGLMGKSWACNLADNIQSSVDLCISDDHLGKFPQHFSPYVNMELDFIDPIIHNPESNQTEYHLGSNNVINQPIVIPTSSNYHPLNTNSTEYFVAEVKNTSGFNLGLRITGLRTPRLLISHIKPTPRLKRLGRDYSTTINDQLIEIERQGSASNTFEQVTNTYSNNDYFSPTTTPNSNTRAGVNTGITIDNIITNSSGNFSLRVTN